MSNDYPKYPANTAFQDQCFPNPIRVKFKRLQKDAVAPTFARFGDAGADITATSKIETRDSVTYGTGLAIEIPVGYCGLLMPRSSVVKKDLMLGNSVGLVDSGYRGELTFLFRKTRNERASTNVYNIGDRIGQLVVIPFPVIDFQESEELSESDRGTGGVGSTGK